jgi:large subunit ribosomal protein L7Ae
MCVQSKARLGAVVHKKTATALAFTEIRKEDQAAFNKHKESSKPNFNDRFVEFNRRWGGGIMGAKTVHKVAMYEKQKAKELAARQG